jgi:hypothetical protein
VEIMKLWQWNTIEKNPDSRKNWRVSLKGNEQHIDEVEKCIKNAVDSMNFHRIKLNIEDDVCLSALTDADFVQSAVADGVVSEVTVHQRMFDPA